MKLTFKKAVIIILTVTSCYSSAYAWIPPWKRDIFNFCKATVDRKNFTDSIPFEFINNRIIIPVIIEGDTLRYIFDTGASMTIT
ncbi:MAG: hypothetical protein LBR64_07995, partial [Dysgonamonadaceae bacterium]|nr:hypothetical protein [Dysgonamonadaceae bacterium]